MKQFYVDFLWQWVVVSRRPGECLQVMSAFPHTNTLLKWAAQVYLVKTGD